MKTVIMAIAVIVKNGKVLLRKPDPAKNPYREPWALFGGRLEGDGSVEELLNSELSERWSMSVAIKDRLWWDTDQKPDLDGEDKRFIYLDVLCSIASGDPSPSNPNETVQWVALNELHVYELNPPSLVLLRRLGYLAG